MTTFWCRIVDEPGAFPPELCQPILQLRLTTLRGKCRQVFVGTMRLITAEAI